MTFSSIMALLGSMIVLAAILSVSVVAVLTQSASLRLIHGVFTTLGIVCGDIIFIVIVIWGLTFLAETMGSLFTLIKYLGGAYSIGLGLGLCRSKSAPIEVANLFMLSSQTKPDYE